MQEDQTSAQGTQAREKMLPAIRFGVCGGKMRVVQLIIILHYRYIFSLLYQFVALLRFVKNQ